MNKRVKMLVIGSDRYVINNDMAVSEIVELINLLDSMVRVDYIYDEEKRKEDGGFTYVPSKYIPSISIELVNSSEVKVT